MRDACGFETCEAYARARRGGTGGRDGGGRRSHPARSSASSRRPGRREAIGASVQRHRRSLSPPARRDRLHPCLRGRPSRSRCGRVRDPYGGSFDANPRQAAARHRRNAALSRRRGRFRRRSPLRRTRTLAIVTVPLSAVEQQRKRTMLERFRTQQETLAQFSVAVERFRRASRAYDFTRLPNGGDLYYERFPWGLDGQRWLGFVRTALLELELSGRC